jgi:heme-degrading monooxygenase HmoA
VFDVFGTVVDWRGSVIAEGMVWGKAKDRSCEYGGRSTPEKSGEYVQHATSRVCPTLRAIAAHRGAYLLRRAVGGAVELVVLTIWESMESVRKFAGDEPEQAVVEPEAGVHGVVSDRKGGKSCGELRCLQPRARFPLNRSYVD